MHFHQWKRREFIKLLGGMAAEAWPLVARAQEAGRNYRVGGLTPRAIGHDVPAGLVLRADKVIE